MRKNHVPSPAPAPSPLARALHKSLRDTDHPMPLAHRSRSCQAGFTLIEVMLGVAGAMTLAAGGFYLYQSAATNASVRVEQANVRTITTNAQKIYGSTGSYSGATTTQAITDQVPPRSMVVGSGLLSRWDAPVLLQPVSVDSKPNSGLQVTYNAVPSSACTKFASRLADGMWDVQVDGASVLATEGGRVLRGRVDPVLVAQRCSGGAPVVLTYHRLESGLTATLLPPVLFPPPSGSTVPPPNPGIPPSAPPVAAPPPPAAAPIAPPPSLPPTIPPSPPPAIAPLPPACVAPPSITQTRPTTAETRNLTCPAGQGGAITQSRTQSRDRTVSYTCTPATGAYTTNVGAWGAAYATPPGTWTTTSNTCTPYCSAAEALYWVCGSGGEIGNQCRFWDEFGGGAKVSCAAPGFNPNPNFGGTRIATSPGIWAEPGQTACPPSAICDPIAAKCGCLPRP